MSYNWQQPDWPNFKFDPQNIEEKLFAFAEQTGHVTGLLRSMPETIRAEALIDIMVAEAIKTSEIEGEFLSRQDIVSSIKNNLGLNEIFEPIKDKSAQGVAELMMDVRKTFIETLTESKLFDWHNMVLRNAKGINVGQWRTQDEPMRVISGAIGKEKIHFEAPPSSRVQTEMDHFIIWFNNTAPGGSMEIKKAPLRAAIAHLYFESIHPFEDGNGRMGRAIAEKALSQTLGRPVMLSLSKTIESDKKSYYNALEQAQKINDITNWVEYFVEVVLNAQVQAVQLIDFIIKKSKFFDKFKDQLNDRQLKVVRRMLDEGANGFIGGINAKKYMSISTTSKATATRDLQDLAAKNIILVEGGGRSTRYILNV